MEFLSDYSIIISFFSLTLLEIVLGIDNIVFISLLVGHLPKAQRNKARISGLLLALIFRIIMLLGAVWIIGLTEPWLNILGLELSGKNLLMLIGGIFLIYKATDNIHDELTNEKKEQCKEFKGGFLSTISQIVLIDIVFSFDSVITAVGITSHIYVIIAAMTIAMIVMIISSGYIADFIDKYPTKDLCIIL